MEGEGVNMVVRHTSGFCQLDSIQSQQDVVFKLYSLGTVQRKHPHKENHSIVLY